MHENLNISHPVADKIKLAALVERLPCGDSKAMHDVLADIVAHCDAMAYRWAPEYHIAPDPAPCPECVKVAKLLAEGDATLTRMEQRIAHHWAECQPLVVRL